MGGLLILSLLLLRIATTPRTTGDSPTMNRQEGVGEIEMAFLWFYLNF